jgi:hypothetical protein
MEAKGETYTQADIENGLKQYPGIDLAEFMIGVKNAAEMRRRSEIEELTAETV